MKIFLSTALLFASASAFAQGINFETGSWKSVLDKASKEKKLVYVDVYTTWCGPCKILASQIFPKQEAGDVYNKHFVNYRLDAEAGEGIDIAKQYAVNGYPTHLFIDPATKQVVYRDMGASAEVKDFNHHAEIALQEYADPMTLDKYAARFRGGEKSLPFLHAYLEKTHRLQQPNDAILGPVRDAIAAGPAVDSNIEFLISNIQTVNNKAVPYVFANAGDIAARKQITGPADMYSRWSYATFERAVKAKNPVMLDSLRARTKRFTGTDDEAMDYWYRTQYFTKIGDASGALKAGAAEAGFLTGKPDSYYTTEDAKQAENGKQSLRWQLKAMNVDSSKIEDLVKVNLEKQPAILHSASFSAANKLNSIAWDIYEKHAKDPALVKQALGWSKRSLDLTAGMLGWASYADTYAHLLYVSGHKAEAIKMQEEAVAKAGDDAASLREGLEAMKAGKL